MNKANRTYMKNPTQNNYLHSFPKLNLDNIKVHGTPGVFSGAENEVYVLLQLPRGKSNLVLNRHYIPIGYLSPKDSETLRASLAPCEVSDWAGEYPSHDFHWRKTRWYKVQPVQCPNCYNDTLLRTVHPHSYRCEHCGRFVARSLLHQVKKPS